MVRGSISDASKTFRRTRRGISSVRIYTSSSGDVFDDSLAVMELMIGDETICLRKRNYRRYYFVVGVLAGLGGFLIGILLGRFAIPRAEEDGGVSQEPRFSSYEGGQQSTQHDLPPGVSPEFHRRISADNIRDYLR